MFTAQSKIEMRLQNLIEQIADSDSDVPGPQVTGSATLSRVFETQFAVIQVTVIIVLFEIIALIVFIDFF